LEIEAISISEENSFVEVLERSLIDVVASVLAFASSSTIR